MTEEESIILGLWIEFAIKEDDDATFRCMGTRWHGYIGALQTAEKYLKAHSLINYNGEPVRK